MTTEKFTALTEDLLVEKSTGERKREYGLWLGENVKLVARTGDSTLPFEVGHVEGRKLPTETERADRPRTEHRQVMPEANVAVYHRELQGSDDQRAEWQVVIDPIGSERSGIISTPFNQGDKGMNIEGDTTTFSGILRPEYSVAIVARVERSTELDNEITAIEEAAEREYA